MTWWRSPSCSISGRHWPEVAARQCRHTTAGPEPASRKCALGGFPPDIGGKPGGQREDEQKDGQLLEDSVAGAAHPDPQVHERGGEPQRDEDLGARGRPFRPSGNSRQQAKGKSEEHT